MTAPAEQVTPHDNVAECAVLGAVLVNADLYVEVADILKPTDFWRDAHQRIFRAMSVLSAERRPIDLLTVKDCLAARGELEEVGGPAYIASLSDGVPFGTNATAYAAIVLDRAQRRTLQAVAKRIHAAAVDLSISRETLIDSAERAVFAVSHTSSAQDFVNGSDLAASGFEMLERLVERKGQGTGVPTGFSDFDAMTRGLQPGTLTIVGARPSMGKTAFALNIAFHVAKQGRTVAVFSMEMSKDELLVRLIADAAHVDGHRLQAGYISDRQHRQVAEALCTIGESALMIDDSPDLAAMAILRKIRRLKAAGGVDLVVVDYLQLMRTSDRAENRNLALGEVSRSLKRVAKEMKVPVLALSQLSRDVDRRNDKRPQLSDLRESGSMEQDADVVVFIHRPNGSDGGGDMDVADIIIEKQRNGPIGTVKLRWRPELTRFENVEPRHV